MKLFEIFPVNSPLVLKLITELLNSKFDGKKVDTIDFMTQVLSSKSVDMQHNDCGYVDDIRIDSMELHVSVSGYTINDSKEKEIFHVDIPFLEIIAFLKYG